ncbi:MAG TPA: hypothetical protein VGJ55_16865, partial [Pyrinomonadaceae bacterium]
SPIRDSHGQAGITEWRRWSVSDFGVIYTTAEGQRLYRVARDFSDWEEDSSEPAGSAHDAAIVHVHVKIC